ncbi:hypothetical protein ElyMa_001471200 [Elysia marginata]|uniref:Uncharacterized protein n=1 Tax=Elysia marginata TaxID=1093978 RepID=A0AAV4J0W8_9GAST|nr:hypothetical protein ElyMa_001471200 [Elysia marginata]
MISSEFITYCFFNTRHGAAFFYLTIEHDDCSEPVNEESVTAVRELCDRFYPYCEFKASNSCKEEVMLHVDRSITNIPMIPFYRYCLRQLRTDKPNVPPTLDTLVEKLRPYDTSVYESWFQEIVLCSNSKSNCDLGARCMSPEATKHMYFRILAAAKLLELQFGNMDMRKQLQAAN